MIIMAARFSQMISCNLRAAATNTERQQPYQANFNRGRREALLSSALLFLAADSQTELLDKYLKKSQENKIKNDKERLDSYYKRNYKDYFGLLEGDLKLKQKEDLTESEKGSPLSSVSLPSLSRVASPDPRLASSDMHLSCLQQNLRSSPSSSRQQDFSMRRQMIPYHNVAAFVDSASFTAAP